MLIALLSTLTACEESIGSVESPKLKPPPSGLTDLCSRPVLLPNRELTQREVEAYWITDRERLIRCGYKLQQLIEFYVDRDRRISGIDG